MNILVTGGTGTVGRRCVARLVRSGHTVRVIGLVEDLEIEGAQYHRCDITDYEAVREQIRDINGIKTNSRRYGRLLLAPRLHLLSMPAPARGTRPRRLDQNPIRQRQSSLSRAF